MSDTYNQRIFVTTPESDSTPFVFELVSSVIHLPAKVSIERDTVYVRLDSGFISLGRNAESYVSDDAKECAERFGMASGSCTVCYDMSGTDPELYLCTDPEQIDYALLASGRFLIWDQFEDKPVHLTDLLPSKITRLLGMVKTANAERLVELLTRKLVDGSAITVALINEVANAHVDLVVDGLEISRSQQF